MNRIQLLLADDHAVVRIGLRALFESQQDMEVTAEAADGAEAILRAAELRPDVALVDFLMPQMNGAEVASRLRAEVPEVKVLVLSGYEDSGFLAQVLQAGARGYILKPATGDELIQAVRAVAAGGVYLEPSLAAHLAEHSAEAYGSVPPKAALSERERDVLHFLAVGYTNKEIASRMMLSVKTVETYKMRAMEKLGLRSRVDVVRYACRRGWLTNV